MHLELLAHRVFEHLFAVVSFEQQLLHPIFDFHHTMRKLVVFANDLWLNARPFGELTAHFKVVFLC